MDLLPRIVTALAVGACLVAGPTGAAAGQTAPDGDPSDGQLGPEFAVSGLVLAPLARLSESEVSFDTEVSSAVGMSIGIGWWPRRHLGVAARGVWGPAELDLRGVSPGAAVPDDLGSAEYMAGTLELIYRLRPGGAASLLEPFLALGAGVRDLSLQPQASPEARSATDLAGSVAVGTYVRIWDRTSLRFEARDLVSEFDATETGRSKLQNDIAVSVGLSVRP